MLENLTPEETEAIKELEQRMKGDVPSKMLEDVSLFYRFLKARDFNLKDAELMMRKHIQWYKANGIEDILVNYQPPEVLVKYVPNDFVGFDKEGCPVRYCAIGNTDYKGIFKAVKFTELTKYVSLTIEHDLERLKSQSKKLGKLLTQIVYIYDFDQMTLAKATNKSTLELLLQGLKLYQDNCPERLKAVYIINASLYFTIFFSVIKTILARDLIRKIRVFGTEGWKEKLLEEIDEDVLPAFLGGTRTDPDGNPLCNTFINHGYPVPEKYFFKSSEKSLSQVPGIKKLMVTRFSSVDMTFDVGEPGTVIEWEFETKSRDIGFGLFYQESTKEEIAEVIPKQRIDTSMEPELGMFKCDKVGRYIMVFDNSYSWLHPKEIYCRATLVNPKDQETRSA
ncbi:hypothetical protein X975_08700, partial [Stegodyphus mimosarum]